MQESIASIVGPCRQLAAKPTIQLGCLVELAGSIALTDAQIDALTRPDPSKPYGRRVLMATDRLEVMVATWTPGVYCAPHDHGGSVGAVRILRGAADHHIWSLETDPKRRLALRHRHVAEQGEILACGPDTIHSMASAGPNQPMVTLHLYTQSIPYMVVYAPEQDETLLVDGGCGAWIPDDAPELIGARIPGIWRRHEIADRWSERPATH
ncbi:MAG: cysteine dioxygenase family protein [Myxococcota bacterium]